MPRITACSTLGYCDVPFEVAARQIAARGFRHIEIAHMSYYCRHFPSSPKAAEQARQLCEQLSLTPSALNYCTVVVEKGEPVFPDFLKPRHVAAVETEMRGLLERLALLGVPLLTISVGRRTEQADRPELVEATAAVVDRLAEWAAEFGIRLLLEVPHCYQLYHNVARTAEIFSLLQSSNVGAVVDSSHWTLLSYDLDDLWRAVDGRLWHIHLRDARGGDTNDFQQELELTAGRGECDFRAFGAWLDRHEYQGEVSIEFEYRGSELPLEKIEAEYDFGLRWLAESGWSLPETVSSGA